MPPASFIPGGSLPHRVSQVTALHLGVVEDLLQLPSQLLVFVHLMTLLVQFNTILHVLVPLILVVVLLLLLIVLHYSLDVLTVEDILVSLLLQPSLAFLGLFHQVTRHLLLSLSIKLLG